MMQTSRYLEEKMAKSNCYCGMQVVFVDIVSYSKRRSYAQVKVIHAFIQYIEQALTNTARKYVEYTHKMDVHIRRDVVVLPSGDGAAIAFPFEGIPDMHLFFASDLLRIIDKNNKALNCEDFRVKGWCNCHSAHLLRCGISEGKLILYKDLNDNFSIAGDSVNMAARVMDLADASQIFLTWDAYRQVADMIPGIEVQFRRYRQARIKHDLRIDVYQYINDQLDGLDVSPRGGLGLADEGVEPDDEVTPVVSPPAGTEKTKSRALDLKPIVAGGTKNLVKVRDQMVRIPAGEFKMGNEQIGQMFVEIPQPFLIDKYQITQATYFEVMGRNPSRFVGADHPVEGISWLDAITFCNKLSELSGLEPVYQLAGKEAMIDFGKNGYRLPTEAEWEYCCRGGGQQDRYGPINDVAWYNGNAGGESHDVGKKAANDFGLYDMLGNVWEWCSDWYQRRYPERRQVNYVGPESGFERVLRGGSWSDLPDCIRSSFRHRKNALSRESTHGLRIVLQNCE